MRTIEEIKADYNDCKNCKKTLTCLGLCSDCNKILNSTNPKNTISSLSLNDKLMLFVQKDS